MVSAKNHKDFCVIVNDISSENMLYHYKHSRSFRTLLENLCFDAKHQNSVRVSVIKPIKDVFDRKHQFSYIISFLAKARVKHTLTADSKSCSRLYRLQ
jgi:hypothetical protein